MPTEKKVITARLSASIVDQLDEMARERRVSSGGEIVRRADLVREAVESLLEGGQTESPNHGDDPHDFGAIVLDALEELANEAERQGIEDDPQGFGMAIWPTAENDPRLERLQAIASKLHGALRAV